MGCHVCNATAIDRRSTYLSEALHHTHRGGERVRETTVSDNSGVVHGGLETQRFVGKVPASAIDCHPGLNRNITPENLQGDAASDAAADLCDRQRLVAGVRSWPDELRIKRADYYSVGPVGQIRAALIGQFAIGRIDPTIYPLASAGPSAYEIDLTATPLLENNPLWGVALAWGVALLSYSPFSFRVRLVNWVNMSGESCDRDVTLYADGRCNGNTIFLPFAVRTPNAMNMAQQTLSQATAASGPPIPTPGSNVEVIDLPAGIAAAFSASVELGSAFHSATAMRAGLDGIYDGVVSRDKDAA